MISKWIDGGLLTIDMGDNDIMTFTSRSIFASMSMSVTDVMSITDYILLFPHDVRNDEFNYQAQ